MREPPLQFLSRKILFLGFDISAPQQHTTIDSKLRIKMEFLSLVSLIFSAQL